MKKRFSTLTVVIIGFLMMATGVFASEAYERWAGEDNYKDTKAIFGELRDGIISDKEAKEEVDRLLKEEQDENLSLTGSIEVLNNEKEKLTTEKAELTTELAGKNEYISELETKVENSVDKGFLATEIDKHILVVNDEKNGPKHKYNYIMNQVNSYKDSLGLNNTLGSHGQSDEDKQLQYAIEDMEDIRKEAQALKELLLNEGSATGVNN